MDVVVKGLPMLQQMVCTYSQETQRRPIRFKNKTESCERKVEREELQGKNEEDLLKMHYMHARPTISLRTLTMWEKESRGRRSWL